MSTNDPHKMLTEQDLDRLQLTTLEYYLHESNPANGLIRDKTDKSAPASIAAVGLALATLPILVERGVVAREFAPEVALITLRFFRDSPHGPEADALQGAVLSLSRHEERPPRLELRAFDD